MYPSVLNDLFHVLLILPRKTNKSVEAPYTHVVKYSLKPREIKSVNLSKQEKPTPRWHSNLQATQIPARGHSHTTNMHTYVAI